MRHYLERSRKHRFARFSGVFRLFIYADEREGMRVQDIWEFKDPQEPLYPTEKNSEMLDLVITTSSRENSIVLDCFCGSGTTLTAAQSHGRSWIGIDQSELAIQSTVQKINAMQDSLFAEKPTYEVIDTFSEKRNKRSAG